MSNMSQMIILDLVSHIINTTLAMPVSMCSSNVSVNAALAMSVSMQP